MRSPRLALAARSSRAKARPVHGAHSTRLSTPPSRVAACAASVAPRRTPNKAMRETPLRRFSSPTAEAMLSSQAATRSGSVSLPAESPVP